MCAALLCVPLFATDNTLPKGVKTIQFRYALTEADDFFDTDGHRTSFSEVGLGDYESVHTSIEAAFGVAEGVTIVLEATNTSRELKAPESAFKSSGMESVYAGLRQRLSPPGSSHLLISELGASSPAGYDEDEQLPLGSGGIDWFAVVSYGQDFYPTRGAFHLDITYVFRNEKPDDEIRIHTDFDWGITRSIWLRLAYDSQESKNNSLTPFDVLTYPEEHGKQLASARFRLYLSAKWHADLSASKVMDGRNQFVGQTLALGLGWRSQ